MLRPDALPIHLAASHAVLAADDLRALFGAGYTLRGSEHVLVVRTGREVRVPVRAGTRQLVLDALDRDALGEGPPLRLVGPAGSSSSPPAEAVRRTLRLPAALLRAWGLKPDQTTTVQTGTLAFGDVLVEEGDDGLTLDRVDALAARLRPGDTARWHADLHLAPPASEPAASQGPAERPTGRLITENDVRQARMRNQRIEPRPDQILTPAARSLGRELGVLRDA